MSRTFFVYIMSSLGRVIYVGVTGDLDRRVFEHKHGTVPGFTSRYRVDRLVYVEAREKEIKGWRREKKVAMIVKKNPTWADLAEASTAAKKERKSRSLTLKGGFGMTTLSSLLGARGEVRGAHKLGQR
jgi:putative endonuclease